MQDALSVVWSWSVSSEKVSYFDNGTAKVKPYIYC